MMPHKSSLAFGSLLCVSRSEPDNFIMPCSKGFNSCVFFFFLINFGTYAVNLWSIQLKPCLQQLQAVLGFPEFSKG